MLLKLVPQSVELARKNLKNECLPCSKCGGEIDYSAPTGHQLSYYAHTYRVGREWKVEPRHYGCWV